MKYFFRSSIEMVLSDEDGEERELLLACARVY